MNSTVLFLAAGSGQRMQGSVADKALALLAGRTTMAHCINAFVHAGLAETVVIVYRDAAQKAALQTAIAPLLPECGDVIWVAGGLERQDSVWNALLALPDESDYVYIHDVARPCIHPESLKALQLAVERDGAAALAHPVADTIKRIAHANELRSVDLEDLDRSRLWAMETPQAFRTESIRAAYQRVRDNHWTITDDTAAAAAIGLKTTLVPNPFANPKLTTAIDIEYIETILRRSAGSR